MVSPTPQLQRITPPPSLKFAALLRSLLSSVKNLHLEACALFAACARLLVVACGSLLVGRCLSLLLSCMG